MAWSRFSSSDLYTFPSERSTGPSLECCSCWLMPDGDTFHTATIESFVAHVGHHRAAGHDVPDGLEELIAAEAPEYL
jgi:hypothetical protein